MAPEAALRPEATHGRPEEAGEAVGARNRAYARAWLVPSGSSARWKSATRRFSRFSKRRCVLGREPHVDQRRGVLLSAGRDELVCRLPQHHRGENAAPQLVGHRLVALQHEEPRDAPVVLLRQRAHLSRADDADEAGCLEHLQVVPHRALRRLERAQRARSCSPRARAAASRSARGRSSASARSCFGSSTTRTSSSS